MMQFLALLAALAILAVIVAEALPALIYCALYALAWIVTSIEDRRAERTKGSA